MYLFFFKTRLWEAVKCWDEALHISPNCAALHEMKAQVGVFLGKIREIKGYPLLKVLLQLDEVFPAVKCAERAVELNPTWSIGRQTLGRAQLGFGEVEMVNGLCGNCCKCIKLTNTGIDQLRKGTALRST